MSFQSLEGRVQFGIPYLGYLVEGLQTPGGWLALAWVAFLLVVLLFLPDLLIRLRSTSTDDEARPVVAEPQPVALVAAPVQTNRPRLPQETGGRWHYRRKSED